MLQCVKCINCICHLTLFCFCVIVVIAKVLSCSTPSTHSVMFYNAVFCLCGLCYVLCLHLQCITYVFKVLPLGLSQVLQEEQKEVQDLFFCIICMHTHQQSVVVVVVDDVVDKHIFYVHTDLITCLLACFVAYLLTCLLACERHIVFVFFEVPGKMPSPSSIFVFTDPGSSAEDSEEGLLACL